MPRITGGEISPDMLIALGQVGKKYNLYTKITGGQRVDLFGARVDQLPPIWKELIAAGFESGHAYGTNHYARLSPVSAALGAAMA
jgi:nitrite reductase (NADH) large subunit